MGVSSCRLRCKKGRECTESNVYCPSNCIDRAWVGEQDMNCRQRRSRKIVALSAIQRSSSRTLVRESSLELLSTAGKMRSELL